MATVRTFSRRRETFLRRLLANEPFAAGNRRTAFIALLTFLNANGYATRTDDAASVALLKEAVIGNISAEQLVAAIAAPASAPLSGSIVLRKTNHARMQSAQRRPAPADGGRRVTQNERCHNSSCGLRQHGAGAFALLVAPGQRPCGGGCGHGRRSCGAFCHAAAGCSRVRFAGGCADSRAVRHCRCVRSACRTFRRCRVSPSRRESRSVREADCSNLGAGPCACSTRR